MGIFLMKDGEIVRRQTRFISNFDGGDIATPYFILYWLV